MPFAQDAGEIVDPLKAVAILALGLMMRARKRSRTRQRGSSGVMMIKSLRGGDAPYREQTLLSYCVLYHFQYRRHRHITNQSGMLHCVLSRLLSVPVVYRSWHRRVFSAKLGGCTIDSRVRPFFGDFLEEVAEA